jgi:uncharacterized protein (DUF2164 family)
MEIKLSKAVQQQLTASIQRYIKEEFDSEAGEMKAALFLRFCIE